MHKPRIIARLDIKGPNVVKGIRFEGLRIMGKPQELAERYFEQGADEILYIDTVASLYGRNNLTEVVKDAASRIFIPLTVGGGIRSLEDAQLLLRAGADKITLNTAAIKRPQLIRELAESLGSQAVVLSLEIKKRANEKWEAYIDNGREKTGIDALEWTAQAIELGAGEILVTSVDYDGTGTGYDMPFLARLAATATVPVIASGGAGNPADILAAIREGGVDAIAIASMLHYQRFTVRQVKDLLETNHIPTVSHL